MNAHTLEVFTKFGSVRRDFAAEEIDGLTPERKARFFALVEAAKDSEDAEAEVENARADKAACKKTFDAAQAEHLRLHPPATFHEEWKRLIARSKE